MDDLLLIIAFCGLKCMAIFTGLGTWMATVSLEFETYDSREQTMTDAEICNHLHSSSPLHRFERT